MKDWWKWFLAIIAFFLMVFFLGGRYLSKHWSPIVDQKLRELIHKSSNGLYTLHYSNLDFDPSFGNVTFDSVELIPDSVVYQQLIKEKKAPNSQFHVKLKQLRVKHFSLADILFSKKLSISSIQLESPDVHVVHQQHAFNDSIPNDKKETIYDDFKELFKSFEVGAIKLDTVNFTYTKIVDSVYSAVNLKKVRLQVEGLLIDENSFQDTSRLFYTKSIELHIPAFTYNLSGGLYAASIKDFNIDSKKGLASVGRVILTPNDEAYQALVLDKKGPSNQLSLTFDSLAIKGFSLSDILLKNKLAISEIDLNKPTIQLVHHGYDFNSHSSKHKVKESLYDHIKEYLNYVSVDKINLQKVSFKHINRENGNNKSINLQNVNVALEGVLLDSTSFYDPTRVFYSKMVNLEVPKFTYNLPGGIYYVAFNDLRLNTKAGGLTLGNIEYKPRISKEEFYRLKKKNITMNNVSLGAMRLDAVDFVRLVRNQELFAQSMHVSDGLAAFYQDLRYPHVYRNMIGHDPYEQLMKIPNGFQIDTVYVNNVSVRYAEHSADTDGVGVITFDNARGTLTNVTNYKPQLAHNQYMRADLKAQVMDKATLHVKFGFDMLRKGGYYTYQGDLAPMSATAFNKILEPLASVQLASGNINKISFNMEGTDHKNWGVFKFYYDDLKVNILTASKDGDDLKAKKTLSFLVNKVLVNSSNPDSKGNFIVGQVDYKRVPNYPFFKTLWQSLLQGIVQSVGISPEKEAKLINLAITGGKAVSGIKKGTQEVGKVAKDVGHEVGKAAKDVGQGVGKAVNSTDSFFKKIFKKKKKDEEIDEE